MKSKIQSFVANGKLLRNANEVNKAIQQYEGKEILITIETISKKRSLRQNGYIHELFTIFKDALNELGNDFTMEQVKGICAGKFLVVEEIDKATGETFLRVRGTSELNTTELNEYFHRIIIWAADMFGIILPLPNEELKQE